MKKLISFIAGFAIACGVFSGCVDDNQYVVLEGIAPRSCQPSGSNQTYGGTCGFNSERTMKDGTTKQIQNELYAHVTNAISGASAWSSSGSSSSGSTLDASIPNAGIIYADEIIIRCDSIDGDKNACKGKDPIKIEINIPIKANGGACLGFGSSEIEEWGDNIRVSVQVSYHDPSLITGKTGKAYISFSSSQSFNEGTGTTNPCAPEDAQAKETDSSNDNSGNSENVPSGD